MNLQNELEYKFLLTKNDFMWLSLYAEKKFPLVSDCVQVNYYYDTKDCKYNKQNETIRIRQIGKSLILQYKKHNKSQNNLCKSEEISQDTNIVPCKISFLNSKDIVSLKGDLITERKVYSFEKGIYIAFDINYYLGVCDYELEIEFEYSEKETAIQLMKKLSLKSSRPIDNKSTRFLKRLNRLDYSEIKCNF